MGRKNDGDWFPFSSDYPAHRKTLALLRILGPRADCYPTRLMCWLRDQESVTGEFEHADEVEQAARWEGERGQLVHALRDARILDGLIYHGWVAKGGRSVEKMLAERVRKAELPRRFQGTSARIPAQGSTSTSTSTSSSPERPEGPKGRKAPAPPPRFADFWALYPRKIGKGAAVKAWRSIEVGAHDAIMAAITAQRSWPQFAGDPQYIPYPATWLRARRWEDEKPADFAPPSGERFIPDARDLARKDAQETARQVQREAAMTPEEKAARAKIIEAGLRKWGVK